MSNLDEKLEEAVRLSQPEGYIELSIPAIKQAFIDAGWVDYKKEFTMWSRTEKWADYMTGQEWYDRFDQEIEPAIVENWGDYYLGGYASEEEIKAAAKRAAGIEGGDG